LGILDLFDVIADVQKVKMPKPEPDIFLACSEALGLYPSDCIGVEDAEAGIQAIQKAGMKAVGIGPAANLADLMLSSTAELSIQQLQSLIS